MISFAEYLSLESLGATIICQPAFNKGWSMPKSTGFLSPIENLRKIKSSEFSEEIEFLLDSESEFFRELVFEGVVDKDLEIDRRLCILFWKDVIEALFSEIEVLRISEFLRVLLCPSDTSSSCSISISSSTDSMSFKLF